jgi:hypothetical protein
MTPNRMIILGVLGLVAMGACGTDAVGVAECRDIENVRCEAGAYCTDFRNVSACRRFERDHCLHGLRGEVSSSQTQACVIALRLAGECARDQGPTTEPGACTRPIESSAVTICDVVLQPELSRACAFLVPDEELSDDEEEGS